MTATESTTEAPSSGVDIAVAFGALVCVFGTGRGLGLGDGEAMLLTLLVGAPFALPMMGRLLGHPRLKRLGALLSPLVDGLIGVIAQLIVSVFGLAMTGGFGWPGILFWLAVETLVITVSVRESDRAFVRGFSLPLVVFGALVLINLG